MKKLFISTAAALVAMTGAATAQPFDAKGSAGGWNVFFNQATGGCFIERQTGQDIVMQIGTEAALVEANPDDPMGFLSIWIPGEAPENANPDELVIVEIGPNKYIGIAAQGAREGFHGATVLAAGSELGFDLRNRRSMTIFSTSGAEVQVQLNASNIDAALDALVACQQEMG